LLDQFAHCRRGHAGHAFAADVDHERRAGTLGLATRSAERARELETPAGEWVTACVDDQLPDAFASGADVTARVATIRRVRRDLVIIL
jgi:hypothetical protein